MTSQFYARSHALICTCPKMAFSAPHSTSSPHPAQTEQVRLTRFFALPDSNTSQRVTISVSGHVVVSQMGIVQVPYATVTVKYVRALIWAITAYTMTLKAITKGANIFTGHSGIWHLHYAHLAHYHMPRNTDCDPLGCVGVRQCKKPRESNLFRLR